jgi:glycosidase/predicted alpha/beta superfamily hydrolase
MSVTNTEQLSTCQPARPRARLVAIALLLSLVASNALLVAEELAERGSNEARLAEYVPAGNRSHAADATSRFVPPWASAAVFYQIFPERFDNGDPTNDPTRESLENPSKVPSGWQPTVWTQDWYRRDAWEVARGDRFYNDGVFDRRYGGDLQGILNRLDYLQDLGVNALYLNPIFFARSSHKYDGNSFHHIDPHFGPDPAGDLAMIEQESLDPATWQMTAADRLFFKLVEEVHRRGMRIVIDGVFNHTGRDFPAFRDLSKRQAASSYKDWYIVRAFDDPATPKNEFRYQGWWGSTAMPEFADSPSGDDLHAGPKQYIYAVSRRWMDPNGDGDPADGIDGWRLDVTPDVPVKFWREWNAYIRTINPEAYTVAEIWDEASSFLEEGNFSSTMNYYGFAYPVKGFLIDGTMTASEFSGQLDARREAHSMPRAYALQNLIDSHDTPRVASMIVNAGQRPYERPERYDYDVDKTSSPRWSDTIGVRKPTEEQQQLQRLVALFQMVYAGSPMIYYGTEAGMWGGDDPCNRMPMVWPEKTYEPQAAHPRGKQRRSDTVEFDHALHDYYRKACHLRRRIPTLQHGEIETLLTDDSSQVVIMRRWDDERSIYVIFNRGDDPYEWVAATTTADKKPISLIFTASGRNDDIGISATDGSVSVSVPGREGAVFLQERLIGATASADATVTLVVHPPAGTPAEATLYVAGNHPSLGPWSPNKRALIKAGDGTWRTRLELPDGFELQYKTTLGSWETVEKANGGADIANRTATVADGLVLEIHVATWADGQDAAEHRQLEPSLTGNVRPVQSFHSEVLGNDRNLVVYLPPMYDKEPDRRFPVLYMHDGQNLFDRATATFGVEWEADETAERLIRSGTIEPLIIVGIYTEANRLDELSDTYSEKYGRGGKAALYGRFLAEELKPFIDKTYRTKPGRADTGVGGSSLGGYASLYLFEQYPEVFSRIAAVSPALLWNEGALTRRWTEQATALPLKRTRFWIDAGSEERVGDRPADAYLDAAREFAAVLKTAGLDEGSDYRFVIAEGAEHNESAWRDRFPAILEFLYPAK